MQSITNPVCGRHWDVIQDLLAPSPALNSADLETAEDSLPSFSFLTYAISDKGLLGSIVNLVVKNLSANFKPFISGNSLKKSTTF